MELYYFIKLILLTVAVTFFQDVSNYITKEKYNNVHNSKLYVDPTVISNLILTEVGGVNSNKLDSLGRKTGIWIEPSDENLYISFDTYLNGKKNGLSRTYMYDRELNAYCIEEIREYSHDNPNGQWQIFDRYTKGYAIVDSFSIADEHMLQIARPKYYEEYTPDTVWQSYTREYRDDGLRAEGWVLFDTDYIIDYYQVGEWKYYSSTKCHHEKFQNVDSKSNKRNYPLKNIFLTLRKLIYGM